MQVYANVGNNNENCMHWCTTEGLGMEREYDTPDQTVVVVTSDKDDQNIQTHYGDNDIPGNVSRP